MRRHRVMCRSHRLDVIVIEIAERGGIVAHCSAWEANVTLLDKGTLDWHPMT